MIAARIFGRNYCLGRVQAILGFEIRDESFNE